MAGGPGVGQCSPGLPRGGGLGPCVCHPQRATPLASRTLAFGSPFAWLPLDISASSQDCGLELNDEDGHRCYPLEDRLFCQPCHVKRLEKGPSPAALHQHHF